MRKFLLLLWLLTLGASAQIPTTPTEVPPPPPLVPKPIPGEQAPFNPDQTREAVVEPALNLRLPGDGSEEAPRGPITLIDAVSLALRLQPDLQSARGSLTQAEGSVIQQRAGLLPRLNLSSTFSHASTRQDGSSANSAALVAVGGGGSIVTTGSSSTDRLTNSLGVTQLLFDFGRTRTLVKQADLQRQAAVATVLQTENDVALSVKESFYSLILARRLVQVREGELANRQEQLRLARALYDAGDLAPGDVVRAQTAVTNTVVALNTARQTYELALQDQAQALGLPPLSVLEIVESSEPDLPNKDLSYLLKSAVERRPDMLVVQKNVEAGEAALGAAHALNRPALTAFTGITYQGDINGIQRPTFTAQLQLDFDLYDGGARAGAVKSAEGSLEVVKADYRRTRLTVERDVGGAVAQLLTSERNVTAAQAGVDSAREGVRIAQGRYQVALGTLTDVFDAQANLVTAQTNLANSLSNLDLARARVRHAVASPFEEGFSLMPTEAVSDRLTESTVPTPNP